MFHAHRLHSILTSMVLLVLLALAACGGPSAANTNGTPASAAPTATATAKPAPKSPPTDIQAFCASAVSVAQANQIMSPSTPVTSVDVTSDDNWGVCNYLYSQTQLPVLSIAVDEQPYTGPKPVPQSTIEQLVSQLANENTQTVTTATPVSGIGDQAELIGATVSGDGGSGHVVVLYVLYGQVLFLCEDGSVNTNVDDAAEGSKLAQCAQRVV